MNTTPKLGMRFMATNDIQKEVVFNEAIALLDTMTARSALNRTNTPPGSPANGATYIVGTAPTGAWAGQANKIAFFFNGWRFYTPSQKMRFFNENTSTFWTYSGTTWAQDAAGTPTSLDDLTNVGGAVPENGEVLTWDEGEALWLPKPLPGTGNLGDLADVDLSGIEDGFILIWDEAESEWKAGPAPEGGGSSVSSLNDLSDASTAGAQNGYIFTWSGGGASFVPYSFPSADLKDLQDVTLGTEQPNDVLAWNGATWAPSPAVITYSFLGMVDGPQTFDGYAHHFLVVDGTESFMTFMNLDQLLANSEFKLQDMVDVQTPADAHIGKAVTLAKTGSNFNYVYTTLVNYSVPLYDGETQLVGRIMSLDFQGFDVQEEDGAVIVTALNVLSFQMGGEPVEGNVTTLNFEGEGLTGSLESGVLTVTVEEVGVSSLADLEEVELGTPVDGDVLTYDAAIQKWTAQPTGGGAVLPVEGEAEAALYELGPFAPPTDAMLPDRINAPSADSFEVKNRGWLFTPGPQTAGAKYAVFARDVLNNEAPWLLTARVQPSGFAVAGHAGGIVLMREQNGAYYVLSLGNSNSDTQFVTRFARVSAAGTETIILSEPNYYPWLRLAFDGTFVRAWVSADGLMWQDFSTPQDPNTHLGGIPNKVGAANRSNANHSGNCGTLITYWEDPDFPAAPRITSGYIDVHMANIQDVDLDGLQDGYVLVWDENAEKWVPAEMTGGGGGSIEKLEDIDDVDVVGIQDGYILVWDEGEGKWVAAENAGGGGSADYPDFTGNAGRVLAVNTGETDVEWVEQASGGGGIAVDAFGVGFSSTGTPDPEQVVWTFNSPGTWSLPADLAGSIVYAEITPGDEVVFDITKNGTLVGTATFAVAENFATFDVSGGVSFVAGDRLQLIAPNNLESIADLAATFIGTAGV